MENPASAERDSGLAPYIFVGLVLVAVVLATGMLLHFVLETNKKSRAAAYWSTLNDIGLAMKAYKLDAGTYPAGDGSWVVYDALCVSGPNAPSFGFSDNCIGVEDPPGEFRRATQEEKEDPRVHKHILDPWGTPFRYRENDSRTEKTPDMHNPHEFDMYSCGPNGIDEGGAGDDIPNW